jgi:predicted AlkP superfamily phosphohydrolase/phosphomutase/tetratricopeptide (TPR) repeat protein
VDSIEKRDRTKVLFIGWDAADWRVMHPLVEQGKMPNVKKMMEQGVHGNASTLNPILSPMLWTSITTGKRPSKHGIWGFSEPTADGKSVTPITNASRKCKALWNILSQQGKTCNVVGFWPSHPAEPILGVMVSNWYQQSRAIKGWAAKSGEYKPVPGHQGWDSEQWNVPRGAIYPPRLEKALAEFRVHPSELDASQIQLFVPEFDILEKRKDERLVSLAKVICDASSIHAAVTALMQLEPWDLTAVYYDAIDHFGHGFMKYHPPKQDWVLDEDFRFFSNVIESAYRFHDLMLGVLLDLAGPDTNVILMSDHGFHPDHLRPETIPDEPAGPAIEHRPFGIFVAQGPAFKQGVGVVGASIIDLTPTVLQLFDLPVGRDMDGKVLTEIFATPPLIQRIDSWDDVSGPFDDGRHKSGSVLNAVEQEQMLQQLADLGYIDQPDADANKAIQETTRELKYNLSLSHMDSGEFSQASVLLRVLWETWPFEHRFGIKLIHCLSVLKKWDEHSHAIDQLLENSHKGRDWAKEQYSAIQSEWIELCRKKELFEETKKQETIKSEETSGGEENDEAPIFTLEEAKRFKVLLREVRKLNRLIQPLDHTIEWMWIQRSLLSGDCDGLEERLGPYIDFCQTHPSSELLTAMGRSFLLLGKTDQAERYFSDLDRLDDENVEANLGLSEVFLYKQQWEQSVERSLTAIELRFNELPGHLLLAKGLEGMGEFDHALNALNTAIRLYPKTAIIYEEKIRLLKKLDRLDDVIRAQQELDSIEQKITSQTDDSIIATISTNRDIRRRELGLIANRIPTSQSSDGYRDKCITVVSGLPRSGTSLMMQMLAVAGMPIVSDSTRSPDDSNPLGYFEDKRVMGLANQSDWIGDAQGKAIKIVAPLLKYLPCVHRYRVIFMDRDLRSVVKSQRKMLDRSNRQGATMSDSTLISKYALQILEIERMLATRAEFEVLFVDYDNLVESPETVVLNIANWLGLTEDPAGSMCKVIRPDFRHYR